MHAGIKLRRPVVDNLINWNKKQASVLHDEKFVKLLLVDVFKTESLAKSTLNTLDQEKIRFVRGVYASIEKSKSNFY